MILNIFNFKFVIDDDFRKIRWESNLFYKGGKLAKLMIFKLFVIKDFLSKDKN